MVVVPPANAASPNEFFVRAAGDADWAPDVGSVQLTSADLIDVSGVLTDNEGFGTTAYAIQSGPGLVRAEQAGTFNGGGFHNPLLEARSTTHLTITGPGSQVNAALNIHVDGVLVMNCPEGCVQNPNLDVQVNFNGTVVRTIVTKDGATDNTMGLTIDAITGGYHVHGDVQTAAVSVPVDQPFAVVMRVIVHVKNFGATPGSWEARFDEVSFAPTGPVLSLPAGYTVSGENVVDNGWSDPFAPSDDVVVTDCAAPALASVTSIAGNLIVDNVPGCVAISLPVLTDVGGAVSIVNNPLLRFIDLGSLKHVGGTVSVNHNTLADEIDLQSLLTSGEFTVNDNGSATVVPLGSLDSVIGDLTLETTGEGAISLGNGEVSGDLLLDTEGYSVIQGATAGGDTTLESGNAEAVMRVHLPDGTFETPVAFTITRLAPEALPPEDGTDADGESAILDPVAAYQFEFVVPTLGQDATVTFEVRVNGLDAATGEAFLAALSAGTATLATKGEAPDSTYQAFSLCTGADIPTADGCVLVERLDENGQPTTDVPAIVRFTGVTGHFSTWAVVIVDLSTRCGPPGAAVSASRGVQSPGTGSAAASRRTATASRCPGG